MAATCLERDLYLPAPDQGRHDPLGFARRAGAEERDRVGSLAEDGADHQHLSMTLDRGGKQPDKRGQNRYNHIRQRGHGMLWWLGYPGSLPHRRLCFLLQELLNGQSPVRAAAKLTFSNQSGTGKSWARLCVRAGLQFNKLTIPLRGIKILSKALIAHS